MEWFKVIDKIPKLGDKGCIYSPIREMAVEVQVTRNPVLNENDGFLYWHFIYPGTKEKGYVRIMADDIWKPIG